MLAYVCTSMWIKKAQLPRSVGVAPEMNLRNPLHASDGPWKQGIHLVFENQGHTSIHEYKWHHKIADFLQTSKKNLSCPTVTSPLLLAEYVKAYRKSFLHLTVRQIQNNIKQGT